nr:class I SAM-dependent RNA methyltransferase [Sneathiella chinensis]
MDTQLEILLVAAPGLEAPLRAEAMEKGFKAPKIVKGGVTIKGDWQQVWRANLELCGASRVLARIGSFRVTHLAQLDKRARQFPWAEFLRPGIPVRVEVACVKSKIYHQKAAAQRLEQALEQELGLTISAEATLCIKARLYRDVCTISIDTSGEGLHKRGHKEAVNKAPMRETLAALLLRECGYRGKEPVVDPMCGSGTFVLEAAEIAARLNPGRSRSFAFEQLTTFDRQAWDNLKSRANPHIPESRFYGFDRDGGAISFAKANAKRAGVEDLVQFQQQAVSALTPPDGPAGLVIVNPPYGVRIGETKKLLPLYQSLGKTLKDGFSGWRVGLVTNNDSLAKATGLPFDAESTKFSHGGIPVRLYTCPALP